MSATGSNSKTMDVNVLPTNPDKSYVKVSIPSGVYQSVHALKTQINIPNIHNTEELDEHAHIGRQRGRPRKYWLCEDDVISKAEYHRLIDTPIAANVRQRTISAHAHPQSTNQMLADTTGAFSAIRTHSALERHHAVSCGSVNGCLECYYGNTCCLYDTYCTKGLPIAYNYGMESVNQKRFPQVPYYHVQQPWQRCRNVDPCREVRLLEPSTKCKVRKGEPGPVVIECFSLYEKEYDTKNLPRKEDRFKTERNKEQMTNSPKKLPITTTENRTSPSSSRLGIQPTLIVAGANGRTMDEKLPGIISSRQFQENQQPKIKKVPFLPFHNNRMRHHNEEETLIEQEKTNHLYEIKQQYSPSRIQEKMNEHGVDVYELYHSKYYRQTNQMTSDCGYNTNISSKIEKDAKMSYIVHGEKDERGLREENDHVEAANDATQSEAIKTEQDNCKDDTNTKAKPDNVYQLENLEESGTSIENHYREGSLKKSSSLEKQESQESQNDRGFFSEQQDVQLNHNGKNLTNNASLRLPPNKEAVIVNNHSHEFCNGKKLTSKESIIQESADSLHSFTTKTCESKGSHLGSNATDVNEDWWISFNSRDANSRLLKLHTSNFQDQFHGALQRRNSQSEVGIATTSNDDFVCSSSEKSPHQAPDLEDSNFNTPQSSPPERTPTRHGSIDDYDEHGNRSQRKSMYLFDESAPRLSQSTSLTGSPENFIEQNTVDPYSPESLSGDTWDKMSQEMYQETLQNGAKAKSYICEHCGRKFSHVSSLNNHIRRHTGLKPFRCRYCGKRFAQSGVLTAHLRTHTGDRPFECVICKKRFAQTTTLANHIRTHTGHKPFSCRYCKRKFAQSSTRNKHELSHTKEKPYICKYCGRTFAQSATVTRHMRIHMRQDGFLCVYCGKEFPYLHALDKHLDSHSR